MADTEARVEHKSADEDGVQPREQQSLDVEKDVDEKNFSRSSFTLSQQTNASDEDATVHTDQTDSKGIESDTPTMKMTKSMWISFISVQFIIFAQLMSLMGVYLVIPFYVTSTPENGWTVTDLSIIFGIVNFGALIASQMFMIAQCSLAHRNTILFICHLMQFVMGFIGVVLMSSVVTFNLTLFCLGAFMVGFSTDITTIEAYGPLISDYEEFQMLILGAIGKVGFITAIIASFALPAIYESFGFDAFCGTLSALQLLAIVVLCSLWSLMMNASRESDEDRLRDHVDTQTAGKTNTADLEHTKTLPHKLRTPSKARLVGNVKSRLFVLRKVQSMKDLRLDTTLTDDQRRINTLPSIVESQYSETVAGATPPKWMNVPTMVLLMVSIVTSSTCNLYTSSFPIVFAQQFGIDSETSGQLTAAGNVFSFILLSVFLKLSSKFSLFQYPYDILIPSSLYVIGNVLFVVFYAEWIAYSVHWIISGICYVTLGVQIVSRLYLISPAAFNKVASISGAIKTIGFLCGSVLGPILFEVHHQLPFVVIAVLNLILIIVIVAVYVYRKRILSEMEFDDDIKGQYLLMERAANDQSKSAEEKEKSKLEICATRRMLKRHITAADLTMTTST